MSVFTARQSGDVAGLRRMPFGAMRALGRLMPRASSVTTLRPVISVHVPKASGTSVYAALRDALGRDQICQLYDDPADPTHLRWIAPDRYFANCPTTIAPYRAVHGHFPASRYAGSLDALRITMLRNPIENMVSIYCYWRLLATCGEWGVTALFALFQSQGLGLLEVAALPLLRRLYSRTYFGDVDLRRGWIVGDYAERAPFFKAVSGALGVELDASRRENVTPAWAEREALLADTGLMRRLGDLLIDDMRFYDRHRGRGC